jgi:serine/threonine protein kinase
MSCRGTTGRYERRSRLWAIPLRVFDIFDHVLSGVEAAHLNAVIHRDIKPENIPLDRDTGSLVVADFGVAHFTDAELYTVVETGKHDRLANFVYAAPEQRARGQKVDARADIWALGILLNELFTGTLAIGNSYTTIGHVCPDFGR